MAKNKNQITTIAAIAKGLKKGDRLSIWGLINFVEHKNAGRPVVCTFEGWSGLMAALSTDVHLTCHDCDGMTREGHGYWIYQDNTTFKARLLKPLKTPMTPEVITLTGTTPTTTASAFTQGGTWDAADFTFNDGSVRTVLAVNAGSGVTTVNIKINA